MSSYKVLISTVILLACAATSQAQVSHHKIVGEYNAKTVIAYKEDGGQATVKDRVELELDWDLDNHKAVGPITIRNFKSEVSDLRNVELSCPKPTPKGEYEHITVNEAKDSGSSTLELHGTRSFPEVSVTADCQGAWHKRTVPAKKDEVIEEVPMIDLDQGSFSIPNADDDQPLDWHWSYTVTLVKKKE